MEIDLSSIKQFGNIEFLAKQLVEGFITGLHSSPYHGFSVEFAEHKLYNSGESTRHIDWKVFGKTDRLYTKRYEEETNLRCQIVVDTSSSMYYPVHNHGKLNFSVLAAAALSYLLQRQKDAVGIATFAEKLELQTPIKSTTTHIHTLFLLLQKLLNENERKTNQKTSVASIIHQVADRMNKRALIVLFSDMFENMEEGDSIFSALQHLRHNHHEVLLFHVIDSRTETDFEFEDRPYEFTDIETGEKVKLHPSQVKDFYKQSISSYYDELKLKCGQFKIDFITADINKGIDQVLLPYLIKRGKMK